MLKYSYMSSVLLLLLLSIGSGCGFFSKGDTAWPVRDINIQEQDLIVPGETRAIVGEEIRWHNKLSVPVHLGFLGVRPIKEIRCGKGFTTWFGEIKDIVTIHAGDYVSACFSRAGTLRYNIWTDLGDPVHTMGPTAVLHLENAG